MEPESPKRTVNEDLIEIYEHLVINCNIPKPLAVNKIAANLFNRHLKKMGYSPERIQRILDKTANAPVLPDTIFNGSQLRQYLHDRDKPCDCERKFYLSIAPPALRPASIDTAIEPPDNPDLVDVRIYRPRREPLLDFEGVERANVSNLFLKSKMFKKSLIRGAITGILAGLAGYGTGALVTLSLLHIMPIGLGLLGVALGFGISIGIARFRFGKTIDKAAELIKNDYGKTLEWIPIEKRVDVPPECKTLVNGKEHIAYFKYFKTWEDGTETVEYYGLDISPSLTTDEIMATVHINTKAHTDTELEKLCVRNDRDAINEIRTPSTLKQNACIQTEEDLEEIARASVDKQAEQINSLVKKAFGLLFIVGAVIIFFIGPGLTDIGS